MGKVTVEKIYKRKKGNLFPTMVNFENGNIAAVSKNNTKFYRLRSKAQEDKFGGLAIINGIMYKGMINNTESEQLVDTYVCVRNKITNNITMIPIDTVRLRYYMSVNESETASKAVSNDISRDVLLKQFGSRKASRYINDHEKTIINMQVMENDLQKSVDTSIVTENDDSELQIDTEYYSTIRPPCNSQTNLVSEIYSIKDIMSEELLNTLEEEAKTVYQTKLEHIPITSAYLLNKIAKLQKDIPGIETFLHLKAIIYMDALLNILNNLKSKSLAKFELSKITEKVENYIRDNFSDPKANYKWARTLYSKEKAICHFIVLSLLIEQNCQIDIKILIEELHVSRPKLLVYAHIVYALPKTKNSTMLTLYSPNKVPPLPKPSGRRK